MSLAAALQRLVSAPRLLVALDFDGVLAPIVDDPATSAPLPGMTDSLHALSALPRTAVALLSGRALADLAALSGVGPQIRLVGSHGAQWSGGPVAGFDDERAARLGWLSAGFERIAQRYDGVRVERKPVSAVLHTRRAERVDAAAATQRAREFLAGASDLHVTIGKEVVDVAVVPADKGQALVALRAEAGADAVLFAGDDVTDERAFQRLGPDDVGVKVGPGDTAAAYRVGSPAEFADVLAELTRLRTLDDRFSGTGRPPRRRG